MNAGSARPARLKPSSPASGRACGSLNCPVQTATKSKSSWPVAPSVERSASVQPGLPSVRRVMVSTLVSNRIAPSSPWLRA
ncbi:hypothetical protein ACVMIH_007086 [Bradyrhizobium sp. USDA 4503]